MLCECHVCVRVQLLEGRPDSGPSSGLPGLFLWRPRVPLREGCLTVAQGGL